MEPFIVKIGSKFKLSDNVTIEEEKICSKNTMEEVIVKRNRKIYRNNAAHR
jgi:hypothetical protein